MNATAARNQFNLRNFLNTPETTTQVPILFYVIHIHNISKSRLNQLDEWRVYEDPNSVAVDRISKAAKPTRVINQVDMGDQSNPTKVSVPSTSWSSNDVYRLTLKDNFDNYCYAYEYNDQLAFIRQQTGSGIPLNIPLGGRLIVNKGAVVMNGVLMLKNSNCQYLGIGDDKELSKELNSGLVGKYIEVLTKELGT